MGAVIRPEPTAGLFDAEPFAERANELHFSVIRPLDGGRFSLLPG